MRLLLCPALAIALASAASAQTAQQPLIEIDDDVMVPGFEMTADTLDDLDVTDPGGIVIGEVEEVLGTSADMPSALAIDFDDSQTDFGDDDRVVNLDQVELANGALVLRMPATGILELPIWGD
ncbi:hypothetical protein [Arenibacterium halophilum]|uniref:PRC-barrel domain-containing protein n=1 Tax=Arenibacterium halophilum TaxID=2583821 RepID=A0ABY2X837_9RHOB|nr:hypothetical protein [Arenibacterium halophilum]TMV11641.1 hypothetical protein FGK64_15320 [Arenibacterium halophilum]